MSTHMTPDQFRHHGKQVIDWIADYWESVERYPVLSQVRPGEIAADLPTHAPERGEPFDDILTDIARVVVPGLTHWQHPSFFAYFPSNTSGPSVLGDLLAAGLGVQGMLWATSPACTELETVVLDWLARLLDLPPHLRSDGPGGGVIQDTASSAILLATVAALHRASQNTFGVAGIDRRHAIYASAESNSAVEKAARIAGIGTGQVRKIPVDPRTLAMQPTELRAAVEADVREGVTPTLVVGTIGTTSTTAVDPVAALGAICRDYGIWLHVDAAYAGVAAVCPELRWINEGLEHVDSYAVNPHKWLLTGFDCDAFYVADRASLTGALSVLPEYLRNAPTESGHVIDYRDWQVPLGRRFRALKLWFVLRWYGVAGLRTHIRDGVRLAARFAELVGTDSRFAIMAPHPFGLVCFRLRANDAANELLLRTLNDSGELYLTHTRVAGHYTLRMAIGATATTDRHIAAAWRRIQEAASSVLTTFDAPTSTHCVPNVVSPA